jgi:hypothetical protein
LRKSLALALQTLDIGTSTPSGSGSASSEDVMARALATLDPDLKLVATRFIQQTDLSTSATLLPTTIERLNHVQLQQVAEKTKLIAAPDRFSKDTLKVCRTELKKELARSSNPWLALWVQKMCFDWLQQDLDFLRANVAEVRGAGSLVKVHKSLPTTAIVISPCVFYMHESGTGDKVIRELGHRAYDLDSQQFVYVNLAEIKGDLARAAAVLPPHREDDWSILPLGLEGLDIDNARNFVTNTVMNQYLQNAGCDIKRQSRSNLEKMLAQHLYSRFEQRLEALLSQDRQAAEADAVHGTAQVQGLPFSKLQGLSTFRGKGQWSTGASKKNIAPQDPLPLSGPCLGKLAIHAAS